MTLCLIETMPLGDVGVDRVEQYAPLDRLREWIEANWSLRDVDVRTGGPARYARVAETGGLIGFITPHTHNFCETCNRVRVTATGTLHTCLGQDDAMDLKGPLRASREDGALVAAIESAIGLKPRGHDFVLDARQPARIRRHMSATGG